MAKPRYKVDLSQLMSECDANYVRLMKLMPNMEQQDQREFGVAAAAGASIRMRIRVRERCKYTTFVEVEQQAGGVEWGQSPCMAVRIYHDARMAEVEAFQRQRHFQGRYEYPNAYMHQQDEKAQLNLFLGEWLTHCLQFGHAIDGDLMTDEADADPAGKKVGTEIGR